jgi:superfamily II DNA helicase RecQ
VDYKEQLQPDEFLVFSRLREWRRRVADEEAVPVYTIFTNGQLAEIVTKKVASKSALGSIIGVGEARLTKYGDGLLSVIGGDK